MHVEIILQLLLALGLGALIGLERGIKNSSKLSKISFGDIRTFGLIALLGGMLAFLAESFNSVSFIIAGIVIFSLFILVYYIFSALKGGQYGLTTEIATILTFLLGILVMIGYTQMAILLSVVLTFIMSLEGMLDSMLKKIGEEELQNTIKFAVIAIVVLPLLPDVKYSIMDMLHILGFDGSFSFAILNLDFFNPYSIWFFVVLMSGISYIGYIMSKIIGEKSSIVVSGAIGGLISSTAVTASMSELSKKDLKNTDVYVVSTLIASTIMFVRVIVIVLFFNINMLTSILLPAIFMLVGIIIYMIIFYIRSENKKKITPEKPVNKVEEKFKSPFRIAPALKFAAFVLLIKFIAGVGSLYQDVWGDYFFYALGIISGLADVDAISQTMSVDAIDGRISTSLAAITIIIAVISNNFVKGGLALKFGEKKFGLAVIVGFIVSMIMGVIGVVLLNLFFA